MNERAAEQNPLGIHYLKFVVAVMLTVVHCEVFVRLAADIPFDTADTLKLRLLALLPSPLLIPFTAGATQALVLNPYIQNGRLSGFAFSKLVSVLFVLALLESVKAMLLGPGIFFGWDVLHMVAIAMTLILALSRVSIKLVWLSAVACLLLTLPLRALLAPLQVSSTAMVSEIHALGLNDVAAQVVLLIVYVAAAIWLIRTRALAREYRLRSLTLLTTLFALSLCIAHYVSADTWFLTRILNLPAGALVGDSLGLHFWPLFPWYSSVALGFILFHSWSRTRFKRLFPWALAAVAIAILVEHFLFEFTQVARELDPKNFWSAQIFNGSLALFFFSFAMFTLYACACYALSRASWLNRLIERRPQLFHITFVYSKTIFWNYFFTNTAGLALSFVVVRLLPPLIAITLFPIVMVISWYWIGEALRKFLTEHRLAFKFSRRERDVWAK